MSNAERLIEILGDTFGTTEVEVDLALIERMIERIEPIAADDIVIAMNGADGFVATWEGAEGMHAAWSDWLAVFASLRLEFESLDRYGDNLITVVRQSGTSRHGVELEQPSAAVWKFRDGMIGQLEFHLNREAALASARDPL